MLWHWCGKTWHPGNVATFLVTRERKSCMLFGYGGDEISWSNVRNVPFSRVPTFDCRH